MGSSLVALLLLAAPSAPDSGWLTLRWGMSKREVVRALRDNQGPVRATSAPTWPDASLCDVAPEQHGLEIHGRKPRIQAMFRDGHLERVTLVFRCDLAALDCERFRSEIATALAKKYGPPASDDAELLVTGWRSERAMLLLSVGLPVAARSAEVVVDYLHLRRDGNLEKL